MILPQDGATLAPEERLGEVAQSWGVAVTEADAVAEPSFLERLLLRNNRLDPARENGGVKAAY